MRVISRAARRGLEKELPEWVASGAITPANAAAITRYYADAAEPTRRTGFLLLAMLGSTLVAAGIILLIAHNWEELSRPVRSTIAFLPLLASHALVFLFSRDALNLSRGARPPRFSMSLPRAPRSR